VGSRRCGVGAAAGRGAAARPIREVPRPQPLPGDPAPLLDPFRGPFGDDAQAR